MTDFSENIININIEDEMRTAYIDYSMSVIVSRALPDVRDGLKPVHRRVLFGMLDLGVLHNRSYKKSARIVGEVLGKYHPHGDTSVYDAMVRMSQEWSLRYPLVDGQGNFGSIDGDSPAAMRYTEARLNRIAEELLKDINKDTIDFSPNFDDSLQEPSVLPAILPNLLLNGTSGIAVGMATNMPPHNLREVIDGICAYIDNSDISITELMQHYIKAPDFPTGGVIYGYQGIKKSFETGRGRIVVRAKADFETTKSGKEQIVVTEIPYMVNKASMIEKTASLINEKILQGISDIRDESDRNGLRVVYELKRDAIPNIVLNSLYKHTQLQSSFNVNNVALVKGRPKTLNLKELIQHFVEHRHEAVVRRTKFELKEAQKREHILKGYLIALDHLDEVINLIRSAKNVEEAKKGLIENFELSEIQSKAILELRLQRLTGLEREKIQNEYDELVKTIQRLNEILNSKGLRMQIITDELVKLKDTYGDERRTEIVQSSDDINIEDLIPNDSMVITVSNQGYIKRTPLSEYRTQSRGGIGSKGVKSKTEDFTEYLFTANSHDYLLIFTDFGKVFWKKVYELPEGSKVSQGRAMQNLINIAPQDTIKTILNVHNLKDEDYVNNHYITMCTQNGIIKKTRLEAYSRPRQGGVNAITINEGDKLIDVRLTNGNNYILIAANTGRAIHFHEKDVRSMGRTAAGVRGISLNVEKEKAVGMVCVDRQDSNLLVVSENGYGKRSAISDYRITKRGGKGVKTINVTEKTGLLVAIKEVVDTDHLMIIKKSGVIIRLKIEELRIIGRATQGVKLIKLNENDQISSIECIKNDIVEDEIDDNNEEKTQKVTNITNTIIKQITTMKKHTFFTLLLLITGITIGFAQYVPKGKVSKAETALSSKKLDIAKAEIDKAFEDDIKGKVSTSGKAWFTKAKIYKAINMDTTGKYDDLKSNSLQTTIEALGKVFELEKTGSANYFFANTEKDGIYSHYMNIGITSYTENDFQDAYKNFQYATEVEPEDTTALLYTAIAASQIPNYGEAIEYYKRHNEVQPLENIYASMLSIYLTQKDTTTAVDLMKEAIDNFPENKDFRNNYIVLLINLKKSKEAEAALKSDIEKFPNNIMNYFQLGILYTEIEEEEKAIETYKKGLEIDSKYFEINYNLGVVYFNKSKKIMDELNAMNLKEYHKMKKSYEARANEEYKKALPYLEAAYEAQNNDTQLISSLIVIYNGLKMKEKAEEMSEILERMMGLE